MKLGFLALFFSILGGCSMMQKDKDLAQLHLRVGTSQLQSGLYPQALSSLLQAEKLDPKNPAIQNNLGLAYFVRDRLDLAEKHIRRSLDLDPLYSDARNNLARVLIETGNYPGALDELKKVLNDLTYSAPAKPLFNSGLAHFFMKQYSPAEDYFRKSLRLEKDNCLAQSFLGRTFFETKNWLRAAENLDRAVGLCQKDQFDEPQYFSGLAYFELGQIEKAEARWDELIKIYPNGRYRD
ncbi:MAG: tetratricopeptide repeat protein, partial [Bdellovibrio sp.]